MDFKLSQVKTFILLPNSKAAATKRTLSKARSEREQCNTIPQLAFTLEAVQVPQHQEAGPDSPSTALRKATWFPGDKLRAGRAVSLCCKHKVTEPKPYQAHVRTQS